MDTPFCVFFGLQQTILLLITFSFTEYHRLEVKIVAGFPHSRCR
uniref:Uncharacterized protein n=1 Tax=Rhizophora mucronata TaxID=61149 RepID=A0A2P2NT47_RHIMU